MYKCNRAQALRFETNDNDALIPEIWANEAVAILIENMVAANLIHRDFSPMIAKWGDIVNTSKPSAFTARRKSDTEDVTVQNAVSTNIPVPLNQHFHVSFRIRDGEESKAFKDLVATYLTPAVVAIAQAIDKVVLGQAIHFIGNVAGYLGGLFSTTAKDYILDVRQVLNANKAPIDDRSLILSSGSETATLKDDDFTSAEKVGDAGTALRNASLGHKLGFNIFMCQNMSDYTYADVQTATTINAGTLTAGTTTVTLTTSANITIGDMVVIGSGGADDEIPHIVTANNGTTEVITITPALLRDIDTGDAVTIYDGILIKQATATYAAGGLDTPATSGYRAGFHGAMYVDGITANKPPQVGQFISIGTHLVSAAADAKYCITEITYVTDATDAIIYVDRPLDAAIVDNAIVSCYPSGKYNFAFHRNALAFVSRPLAQPRAGTGALSAVVNYDNIAIRATITYDGIKQGHLVTVDLLCGIAVLDTALGAVMLG